VLPRSLVQSCGVALCLISVVSNCIEITMRASAAVDTHARQLAALGSPVRLAVLRFVVQGDRDGTVVGDIQAKLGVPWSTLSHHLDRLTTAGLLEARPDGRFIFYRADYDALRALTDYLWEDCCKGGGKCC
jgi:ArsR family transcriptional regulator, arsenate/arsenite/antimonite-responsive transcriptional repressor